jgi:hypothetical protein
VAWHYRLVLALAVTFDSNSLHAVTAIAAMASWLSAPGEPSDLPGWMDE